MTTPTREQVVQWGKEAEKLANAACKEIPGMEYRAAEAFALITLARSDLEASIAEQAKQIEEMAEAIKKAADQIRVCDYTPARSTLLVAIAAMSHKESGE